MGHTDRRGAESYDKESPRWATITRRYPRTCKATKTMWRGI